MNHIVDRNAQTLSTGLILNSNWGYDQTNVDFYIVTNVSGQFVKVRKIKDIEKSTGPMFGVKSPVFPIEMVGPELRRKMKGAYVAVSTFAGAFPWSGEPMEVSHTH